MHIPLDEKLLTIHDLPYTISFVIRKRQQIDSLKELPKEKQPPDYILWDSPTEELEVWLDKVMNTKEKDKNNVVIFDNEIEP